MSRGRSEDDAAADERTRLDKWLWAARFYKTRSLAQAAVEGGKVHYEGQRVKPGHAVRLGARLSVRSGFDEREVIVRGLSEQRGSATVAQGLYEETADSIARRERTAALRKAAALSQPTSDGRPDKRQRRQWQHFQQHLPDQD
ncbi:MAG TPA: ribosome-associated heat shock protein Hsp15 [Permianibacter sp.]|nr:ribosome-associated heat shock protein Hsp15 [Permianibacter sp.]